MSVLPAGFVPTCDRLSVMHDTAKRCYRMELEIDEIKASEADAAVAHLRRCWFDHIPLRAHPVILPSTVNPGKYHVLVEVGFIQYWTSGLLDSLIEAIALHAMLAWKLEDARIEDQERERAESLAVRGITL